MYKRVVRVIYPLEGGRIVLGTASTLDEHIEASTVSGGGHVYEFTLTSERPFLYCKPCIVSHTGVRRVSGPETAS